MRIGRRGLLAISALALGGGRALAESPGPGPETPHAPQARLPLWPPGALEPAPKGLAERLDGGVIGVVEPRLEIFRPAPAVDRKRAMLVIPGGGYQRLVLDNEGYGMARYLAAHGVTAGVLIHRLPAEGWSTGPRAPLQDAQRGLKLMRMRAADWGVDADRIGVVGFSSGGHLAGMLAARGGEAAYPAVDASDALSARPAFAGLIYPVIDLAAASERMASRRSLVGAAPTEAEVQAWSVQRFVTAAAPPCFLVHAADDPIVPPGNSLSMYAALLAAKVSAELHLFETGGHGFGLVANATATAWPDLFLRWADAHGLGG